MSEEKDKDTQPQQASKDSGTNEKNTESVNTAINNAKRRPGCNRPRCYCVR